MKIIPGGSDSDYRIAGRMAGAGEDGMKTGIDEQRDGWTTGSMNSGIGSEASVRWAGGAADIVV